LGKDFLLEMDTWEPKAKLRVFVEGNPAQFIPGESQQTT